SAARDATHERAILSLIEKCARLLSGPRRGEHADAMFRELDLLRHVAGEELDDGRKFFARADRYVFARENPRRLRHIGERFDYVAAACVESGAQELDDQIFAVPVADERRAAVR